MEEEWQAWEYFPVTLEIIEISLTYFKFRK